MSWAEIALAVVSTLLIAFAAHQWRESNELERELDIAQRERDQLSDSLANARRVRVYDVEAER